MPDDMAWSGREGNWPAPVAPAATISEASGADISPLFPTPEVRAGTERMLGALLCDSRSGLRTRRVAPGDEARRCLEELAGFDFTDPVPLENLLPWTISCMERGIVQVSHPRYFGLFNPTPSFPAECADRIAASFNPQLASATTSPFPVAVEAHVIAALGRRANLPAQSCGHFTSGGSEANFAALQCALTHAHPGFATKGARAFSGAPIFYVSRDAHLAWLKIAHEAGIGREAVRLVNTDGSGRLSLPDLEDALRADRAAGHVPVMIVATAGTTGGGMIDPLHDCAAIAQQQALWLHVDAAWGGAALASNTLRAHLAGIERADSITIDAHKWFATTMGCGMFLCARPDVVRRAFAVSMECMPSCDPAHDPYVTSAQWSRRFVGLRLFLAFGVAGWPGYAAHVEAAVSRAAQVSAKLRDDGWRQINASPLAVLCMLPPRGRAGDIARRVVQSGDAWVSTVTFEGQEVLRLCMTSGETTDADLEALIASLRRALP